MNRLLLSAVSLASVAPASLAVADDVLVEGIDALGNVPHGWLIITVTICLVVCLTFAGWVMKNKGDTVSQGEFARTMESISSDREKNSGDHTRIEAAQNQMKDDIGDISSALHAVQADVRILVDAAEKRRGDGLSDSILDAIRQGIKEIKDDK